MPATSPATARRSRSSRPPSRDSRSSLPAAWSQIARGHRPAPRREPRGDAACGVARDARDAGHLAARPGHVPHPRRDPRRATADRRPADDRRARHRLRPDAPVASRSARSRSRSSSWPASVGVGVLIWLVVGGWFAAGLEAGVPGSWPAMRRSPPWRRRAGQPPAGALRRCLPAPEARRRDPDPGRSMIAYRAAGVVLALGSIRLVFVTYRELTTPRDVATPTPSASCAARRRSSSP